MITISTHVNVKFETEKQYCHAISRTTDYTVIAVEIAVKRPAGTYRRRITLRGRRAAPVAERLSTLGPGIIEHVDRLPRRQLFERKDRTLEDRVLVRTYVCTGKP